MAIELTGKVEGSVREHNEATLQAVWDNALLVLPHEQDPEHVIETTPAAACKECFSDRYPTLMFAHGSSGITTEIREFARFIAQETGWAVVVPDSMQTKDRITYVSPVARSDYEAVHAMRSEELLYCAKSFLPNLGLAAPMPSRAQAKGVWLPLALIPALWRSAKRPSSFSRGRVSRITTLKILVRYCLTTSRFSTS